MRRVSTEPATCGQGGHGARDGARRSSLRVAVPVVTLWLLAGPASAEEPFFVQKIESQGRTVTAELVDLDGDGRQDVLQAVTYGMPPDERRALRLFLQAPDGSIPSTPTLETPIPRNSAAYDLYDVDGRPGSEMLLLRPRGIGTMSFQRTPEGGLKADVRDAQIPNDLTIGVSSDERGLDRLPIASAGFGPEPWLVAPGLGETFFLSPAGALRTRIASGARANFFVAPQQLMVSESDIQIFLDAARISVGDIDADGRPDILASLRHVLNVFYQQEDGSYSHAPSRTIELGRISMQDHIRGSGAVRTAARDIDRDGLADLIISETLGGVMDAGYNTYIHFNRGGGWDLSAPDYAFEDPEVLGADQLRDVDGNGTLELMRVGINLSVLELIEIFLTEAIDAKLQVYELLRSPDAPPQPLRPSRSDAWFEVKFDVPLDFETSRPAGFIPTLEYDFNGDGFADYISSTDGTHLEIFVGSREKGYPKRDARQEISTEGQIRPGDVNGDGLTDLVLFNTRRDNQPVMVLVNVGMLPGTVVQQEIKPWPK